MTVELLKVVPKLIERAQVDCETFRRKLRVGSISEEKFNLEFTLTMKGETFS